MAEVVVVDVGHGNCAIVRSSGGEASIIDSPKRDQLIVALEREGITVIKALVASHSDADHCAGFIGVLVSDRYSVGELRLNPDAVRRSRFWGDLKIAWRIAHDRCGTALRTELTSEIGSVLNFDDVSMDVLYPPPDLAMGGVGSITTDGVLVTPNAMSGVIRVRLGDDPVCLLTGDMDAAALASLRESGTDLHARVLVFPHHGGLPERAHSTDRVTEFVHELVAEVQPSAVVFSQERGRFDNPLAEIVSAIRQDHPGIAVGCTQLASGCSPDRLVDSAHLGGRYAAGAARGHCCMGSIVIRPGVGIESPVLGDHQAAVSILPSRRCR